MTVVNFKAQRKRTISKNLFPGQIFTTNVTEIFIYRIGPLKPDPAHPGLGCHVATITTVVRDGVCVGGGGMDAPSLRTSVEAPRGSRSPEPQKKSSATSPET